MVVVKDMMKKMCVIGEAAVGKTSLIRRFVVDKFDDKYIVTIGTKTSKKNMALRDDGINVNLKLMIWDILGQRSFSELRKSAFKGASGAFIVLDVTRRETLDSFDIWLLSLYKVTGEIPVIVLANKNDLKAAFGKNEIEKLVKEYGFPYYLTSAKTGENVNDAFHTLGKMMIKSWTGGKIGPKFEMTKALEKESGSGVKPNRILTALEVEDMIMVRYCDLFEDPDFAMAIIREQYKRAGVNFKDPTASGLLKLVEYLIDAASNWIEAARLEREKMAYKSLIRRIGEMTKQDTIRTKI